MGDETQAHYDRLAQEYDQNWTYSAEFLEWMTECILNRLRLRSGDRVLDVGCGDRVVRAPSGATHRMCGVC